MIEKYSFNLDLLWIIWWKTQISEEEWREQEIPD